MRFFLFITLALCLAPLAGAQTPVELEALTKKEQSAREKAALLESERKAVRQDISSLKEKLAKIARETQSIEAELSSLERQTAELTARITSLTEQIVADRAQYSTLVTALQRLEATPPPTLALSPRQARKAAQAGQLMAVLSEQLKQRADALALNLTALDVTQTQLKLKKSDLAQAQNRLARQQAEMTAGLSSKSQLETRISEERDKVAAEAERLAAESNSLRELIAKLEDSAANIVPRTKPGTGTRPSAPVILPKGTKRFAEAKGGMLRPVSGVILRGFGRGEKGMTFSGRPNGQVLAPYAGRVEFSGPFKNYDQVVILNVGDGYFVLLTGLERLNIGTGDDVRRGEPVGTLSGISNPELYIELRRNGSPVDPSPWLAPDGVKSG